MARLVFGTVKNAVPGGASVAGLRVRAWDEDADGDDLMGETLTNPAGAYAITYAGGHWDPAPHNITTWRPDIYVTVAIRNIAGNWVRIKRSGTHQNHRLRDDLQVNLDVDIEGATKKMTAFNPAVQSFHFDNRFTISPAVFGLELGSWNIGLCGGMVAAALNRFKAGTAIPADTQPPAEGTVLYTELLNRQKKAIPLNVIQRIYDWQSAPDEGHWNRKHSVGYRTKGQWPTLKALLDSGTPVQLVLIRVEGYFANISENHQVLAIGYEWNPTTRDLAVYVYDPNDKERTNTLTMNLGQADSRLDARDSTGERLRGFFINPAGDEAVA